MRSLIPFPILDIIHLLNKTCCLHYIGDAESSLAAVSGRKHPSTIQAKQLKGSLPLVSLALHLITSQVSHTEIMSLNLVFLFLFFLISIFSLSSNPFFCVTSLISSDIYTFFPFPPYLVFCFSFLYSYDRGVARKLRSICKLRNLQLNFLATPY